MLLPRPGFDTLRVHGALLCSLSYRSMSVQQVVSCRGILILPKKNGRSTVHARAKHEVKHVPTPAGLVLPQGTE